MGDITLLDGSIGQELVRRLGDPAVPIWSTAVMMERPGLVEALHRDYFAAGASVATANTYAVLPDRLERAGLRARLPELLDVALAAAQAARDGHGSGRIAGSLGPVGGSYRPDIEVTPAAARALYAETVRRLDAGVDLWLLETVPAVSHAESALAALAELTRKPVWLAITVDDEDGSRLRSGEPVREIADLLSGQDGPGRPQAVLVNCSRPEVVADALAELRGAGLPFGAYANGFDGISADFLKPDPTVDVLDRRADLGPSIYADFAMGWIGQGATIVGGCCEIGPAHIAELARRLREAGHRIV